MDTYKIKGEDHYQCREVKAERDALRAERDALKADLLLQALKWSELADRAELTTAAQAETKVWKKLADANAVDAERYKAERDALKEQVEVLLPICAECYALRADAERYQWLKTERNGGWDDNVLYVPRLQYWIPLRELDAAIDAARGKE